MVTELNIDELNGRFAIAGVAQIVKGEGGLPKVRVTAPRAEGEMYLHGAQVTSWKPNGADEVLFVSGRAQWHEGIAIRGGVPICFPWFRAKADDPRAPAHGIVRTRAWRLESITQEDDAVSVAMLTESDDDTRKWWPFDFRVMHRATFGAELKLELTVSNTGAERLRFEEALHTYHRVGDVEKVRISGLDGVSYLDNTDSNRDMIQQGEVAISKQTDNAYVNTQHAIEVVDGELHRLIRTTKENSLTTVIWNPWKEGAKAMSDLGDDEWQYMVCAEASNILEFAVGLAPGQQHTIRATLETQNL